MTKKQLIDISVLSFIMTMIIWSFIAFYPIFFFKALLFVAGTLAVFIPIFFICAVVITRGSILSNPYPIPIIVIKKHEGEELK